MMTSRRTFVVSLAGAGVVSASAAAYRVWAQGSDHGMHQATPDSSPEVLGCQASLTMGTPMAVMEYDLAYIDMMIPHHESVIALAEVAVDQLSDDRLIAIAEAILETQPAEIEELKQLREEWYGDPEPAAMTEEIMSISMAMEHGGCSSEGHMDQMRGEWHVEQFDQADDKDLAFIDQVIPHHEMAIQTSEVALEQARHQETRDIARRVIAGQQAEIDELGSIREDLVGTPEA